MEDLSAVCKSTSDRLAAENKRLNDEVINLQERVDNQEQQSLNNCLLLHSVQEDVMQNTDEIALDVIGNQVGVTIALEDIQRSHQLGPFNAQRNLRSNKKNPRPIIIRFTSWRKRQEVFKAKRSLKGQRISISENLTKHRYGIYQEAIKKYGLGKVWTPSRVY